ncbi:T9SS type A sorting domain-containing protein [Chryseobacterium gossypii]|uniref:T9SS type A sorting domain-containing protein n=1 Tax=Chryseobacterium gossypii TaxID=3231602 RepID=UPI00352590FF
MKAKLIFLAFSLILGILNLKAQCSFTPEITSPRLGVQFPDRVVFCNTEAETLSTQTYDSYQWYKQQWDWQSPNPNPWVAIPGATSQNLTINGADDMLYYFKVVVTLDGCTAESQPILADGFAYSLPAMLATFTPGTYEQLADGSYNVCEGASVQLENMFPDLYGVHTWYKCAPSSPPPAPGDPCIIDGVTGDSYTATASGYYGFYACTAYCPDQCEFLGLIGFVTLNFGNWSFCSLGTGETKPKENDLTIYPNPATQFLYIGKESDKTYNDISIVDMSGKLVLQKKDHQYKQPIDVSGLVPGTYIIVSKSSGGKVYKNKFIKK